MRGYASAALYAVFHAAALIVPWVTVNVVYPVPASATVSAVSAPLLRLAGTVLPVPSLPGFAPLLYTAAIVASAAAVAARLASQYRPYVVVAFATLSVLAWYSALTSAVHGAYAALTAYAGASNTIVVYEQSSTPMLLVAAANIILSVDTLYPALRALIKRR